MQIIVQTATDGSMSNGSTALCSVSTGAGTCTVPASVLQALPTSIFGQDLIDPQAFPVPFTTSGLNLGILEASDDGVAGRLSLQ